MKLNRSSRWKSRRPQRQASLYRSEPSPNPANLSRNRKRPWARRNSQRPLAVSRWQASGERLRSWVVQSCEGSLASGVNSAVPGDLASWSRDARSFLGFLWGLK